MKPVESTKFTCPYSSAGWNSRSEYNASLKYRTYAGAK
jgi:hypothetical protein